MKACRRRTYFLSLACIDRTVFPSLRDILILKSYMIRANMKNLNLLTCLLVLHRFSKIVKEEYHLLKFVSAFSI
jgi:hypothetical protein